MTSVLLVRHGQSEWNATGRWQGQEDPPLSELGRHQAERASGALGAMDAIYSSPLRRALGTAEIVGAQLGMGPVMTLEGLMERHAGVWQGLTRPQIEQEYPGYLEQGRRPPGWEDDTVVETRVVAALDRIAEERSGSHVLVVAHAGVIFAVERALGADWERLANLAGRWLSQGESGWQLGDRVHLLIEETIPDQL